LGGRCRAFSLSLSLSLSRSLARSLARSLSLTLSALTLYLALSRSCALARARALSLAFSSLALFLCRVLKAFSRQEPGGERGEEGRVGWRVQVPRREPLIESGCLKVKNKLSDGRGRARPHLLPFSPAKKKEKRRKNGCKRKVGNRDRAALECAGPFFPLETRRKHLFASCFIVFLEKKLKVGNTIKRKFLESSSRERKGGDGREGRVEGEDEERECG
jgi:hypothetical protein